MYALIEHETLENLDPDHVCPESRARIHQFLSEETCSQALVDKLLIAEAKEFDARAKLQCAIADKQAHIDFKRERIEMLLQLSFECQGRLVSGINDVINAEMAQLASLVRSESEKSKGEL